VFPVRWHLHAAVYYASLSPSSVSASCNGSSCSKSAGVHHPAGQAAGGGRAGAAGGADQRPVREADGGAVRGRVEGPGGGGHAPEGGRRHQTYRHSSWLAEQELLAGTLMLCLYHPAQGVTHSARAMCKQEGNDARLLLPAPVALLILNPNLTPAPSSLQVVREQKLREKEAKEAELRDLAVRARMERAGAAQPAAPVPMAARGEG
jgi:hypothetical protein